MACTPYPYAMGIQGWSVHSFLPGNKVGPCTLISLVERSPILILMHCSVEGGNWILSRGRRGAM